MYGARELHYYGLLKQNKGFYSKYKTAFFEENNFDVLFLGSSRVEMHYNTRLFDSLTGRNSFNLSIKGATPRSSYAILKAYLSKSKAPVDLIYEIDYHFVKYESPEINDFNNYFPFLSNPVLREEFGKIDPSMKHFYYNPYYSFPYTGFKNLSTSIHGWLNIPNKTDSLYYKGYLKEVFRPSLDFNPSPKYYTWFNVTDRNYLDSIIHICKTNNTRLTLVSSPIFGGGKVDLINKEQIIRQLKNIGAINGLEYHDFSSLPFCNQRNLFVDHYHMNALGAGLFTKHFTVFFNNKRLGKPLK
ncbi:MAG: hypothetical protein K0S32_1304 [Bacteroidetes bacterium]|jgi:hypothetical protein|nr:hypothetical protein [Bacteroidota bacterium]